MINSPTNLTVVVRNKEKILYSGQAAAVTSINEKGIFDVLPQHENFITLIKEKVIIHPTLKENKEIQIENGIVRIYKDKVYIYVNVK
jgi:F0F1-type ATP synthase epsilon subunit